MSAIGEWFGSYSAIFSHIRRRYGEAELERYFQHLADTAYDDVYPVYQAQGLPAIDARYCGNFVKDGGEVSSARTADRLGIQVRKCPAFFSEAQLEGEGNGLTPAFCADCESLNGKILRNAGYDLQIQADGTGSCVWLIQDQKPEINQTTV